MKKKKTHQYAKRQAKSNTVQPAGSNIAVSKKPFKWRKFSVKVLLLFIIIISVVIFTDSKGYFTADQSNNHINRKWKSFYNFTKTKEVDILLLGNSHIITGIDPFTLSVATSCNGFILGNAGTSIADAWFHLGEALKHTNPKTVVLETYCIGNTEKIKNDDISQIQSFEAQSDVFYKLKTMPGLLYSDSWIKAWSPSIRNHSFLLKDMNRIKYNIKNPNPSQPERLDLGRFARFPSGLEDSTIAKYDRLGAPVKGGEYKVSDHSRKYLKKIMALCKAKNIPVVFLTVPMYYKHIDSYPQWKATLNEELQKYPEAQWLDLQLPYDSLSYTKEAFENTYDKNQHLSNTGMYITAYKLADFLFQNNYSLPDRSKENVWIADFKSQYQFVYNQDAVAGMAGCTSVLKDKYIGNLHIKELLEIQGDKTKTAVLKIENNQELLSSIAVTLLLQQNNNVFNRSITMYSYSSVNPPLHKVYFVNLPNDVKVLGIKE
ncbi:MAG: hypothetical protein LBK94_06550 [Prevotellaceae bacterium]|jgi:hypothetical protein|nr:hypothetical protein [Prevotellaceae bacterium]